ncbi:MAG: hypothetical protein WDN08_15670 [Rhizomicrobium sp.]
MPQQPPTGYAPLSVPACTGQPVSLDLSTATGGGDPHWVVSGPAGGGIQPTHVVLSFWKALPDNWIQPGSSTISISHPSGYYTYTIWFNIPCTIDSYTNLRVAGNFSADDVGTIYLNGTALAPCGPCFGGPAAGTPFTGSNLHQGLNSLSVYVNNIGGQSGAAVVARLLGQCGEVCLLPDSGLLKICKVAGPGVALGTPFVFTAGAAGVTVAAGSGPGGTCVVGPSLPIGSTVTVRETIPSGYGVSAIAVAPPSRQAGTPNLPAGSVGVTIGSGVTEVTFTDEKRTGYLEICKRGNVSGSFTFLVGGIAAPFVVPAGGCSPAIELPAGQVTITEPLSSSTLLLGCSTIPATRQVSCNTIHQTSVVTIVAGDISTQTIAVVTNQSGTIGPGPDHSDLHPPLVQQ